MMDKMMSEEMIMGKKKKRKKMMKDDMSQYDETYHWTRNKKDKHFYGHLKKQVLF